MLSGQEATASPGRLQKRVSRGPADREKYGQTQKPRADLAAATSRYVIARDGQDECLQERVYVAGWTERRLTLRMVCSSTSHLVFPALHSSSHSAQLVVDERGPCEARFLAIDVSSYVASGPSCVCKGGAVAHADVELLSRSNLSSLLAFLQSDFNLLTTAFVASFGGARHLKVKYEACDTVDTARSQERYSNALARR